MIETITIRRDPKTDHQEEILIDRFTVVMRKKISSETKLSLSAVDILIRRFCSLSSVIAMSKIPLALNSDTDHTLVEKVVSYIETPLDIIKEIEEEINLSNSRTF